MLSQNIKRILRLSVFIIIVLFACKVFAFFSDDKTVLEFDDYSKVITVSDNGINFQLETAADTVSGLLQEKNIRLGEYDRIIPEPDSRIFPGGRVEIQRSAKITVFVDGKEIENHVFGRNVGDSLREINVALGRLDKTDPGLGAAAYDGLRIIVTRINVEEVSEKEDIDFKTIVKKDDEMGWQEKKIETEGKKGMKEVKYKVTYKNGKEVSREEIETNILSEAVTQVEVHGTYVKFGKSHTGQGTWYAFKGGLYAANPWLPMGSYVKVTNKANGKSVIVQINDRGPFGEGRIIDLDKVAFQKIASLGAGVIDVKMEEILN